jgi:hypothetical protein
LEERDIYKEDWIGLKTLDEKRGLVYLEAEGRHVRYPLWTKLMGRCTSRKSFLGKWLGSIWDRSIMFNVVGFNDGLW